MFPTLTMLMQIKLFIALRVSYIVPKAHDYQNVTYPVPEIIDPVFAKTSQNARFLLSENDHFGLVFVKTGSISSGTG
jgi:hypothetical protein